MIVILGTSNTVGGQDDNHQNSKIMLHKLLSDQLKCEVLNLSVPGRGTELYLENYIHACKEYNPKLFIAEIYIDRTYINFWFPTKDIENIFREGKESIYNCVFEKRYSWKESCDIDDRIRQIRINRITENQEHLNKFKNSIVQWNDIKKLLNMYKTLGVYLDEDYLLAIRGIRNLINLKKLSELMKVPILFVSYGQPAIEFNEPFIESLDKDHYLNFWCELKSGIIEWADQKLQGRHFSYDNDHLNQVADRLSVDELFVPFIKNYTNKYRILL